jgi:hypothetical protein
MRLILAADWRDETYLHAASRAGRAAAAAGLAAAAGGWRSCSLRAGTTAPPRRRRRQTRPHPGGAAALASTVHLAGRGVPGEPHCCGFGAFRAGRPGLARWVGPNGVACLMEACRVGDEEDIAEAVRALAAAARSGLLLRRAAAVAGGSTCLHAASAARHLH